VDNTPAEDMVTPDAPADATPDARPDAAPDAMTMDAAPDATADAAPDKPMPTPDAAPDATPDVAADATPDVAADVATDVATDARPDVADAGPSGMCAAPVATITMPGMAYSRDGMTAGTNNIGSTMCQSNARGPEDVYTLTVTARSVIVADTIGMRTAHDTILSLRRTCNDAMSELACDDDGGGRATTSRFRALLEPGTYSLLVDGYNGAMGPYTLAVRGVAAAANAACATPTTLAPGATLMAQQTGGAGAISSECTSAAGGQLFYSVTVPANSAVTVLATPASMSGLRPVLRVKDTCMATTCATTGSATAVNTPASVVLSNASAMPRTYIVSAADFGTADGAFDLSASAPTMLAANANCAAPTTLAPGATLTAQNSNAGGPRTTECTSALGTQLYYQVTVPAMSGVTVRATPTGTPAWTPVLRARDNCTATACVMANTATAAGMPASVVLNNGGTAARTFVVSVAGSTAAGGAFDLAATAPVSLVPGATCDSPITLTAMTPAMGVDGTRASLATPNRCQAAVTGVQTYFSVTIPPRQRATLRATPTGATAWAPTVRAINNCTATTCLDSRVGMSGMPTVLAYDNGGAFPQTILVSVAGASPTAGGTFDLSVAFADLTPAAAYTFATIAGSCDDVSMGTAVSPVNSMMMPIAWTDDSISPTAELPFPVQLHGAAASHYALTSNGILQLFPNAMGTASTSFSNATIPASGTPNNYIAPFWDDLRTAGSMTVGARVATLGTAPNRRFVAQWTDFTLPLDETARLTFQAKVFETTNVIEFHYCTLTAAAAYVARAAGAEATIGVENAAGDNGFLVGFNRVGTVSTGTAYRLTPR
jgi:hypothetical protein